VENVSQPTVYRALEPANTQDKHVENRIEPLEDRGRVLKEQAGVINRFMAITAKWPDS
jgi:hypothetical protein